MTGLSVRVAEIGIAVDPENLGVGAACPFVGVGHRSGGRLGAWSTGTEPVGAGDRAGEERVVSDQPSPESGAGTGWVLARPQ